MRVALYRSLGQPAHRELSVARDYSFAYDLRDFELLDAPGWIDTARYDILAKTDAGQTSDDQFRERLRSLLANRFALRVHHEARELTSYALTVAKGGAKLNVVTVPGEQLGFRGSRGHNQGFAITMPMFVKELERLTGRPVIDRTGLTGKYDYVLDWSLDSDTSGAGPTIFTALQEQLGLRLESVKAAVDTVVIDHIARPSQN
ncbi:MAG TPA: TIGR03435 family protein [Bryobacteraceae bacterium]